MNACTHTHASQHTAKAFNLFSHFPFAFAGWLHTQLCRSICACTSSAPQHTIHHKIYACNYNLKIEAALSISLSEAQQKKKGCKTSASLTFYLIYTMISGCNNPLGNHFSYKSAFYVSLAFKKQLETNIRLFFTL